MPSVWISLKCYHLVNCLPDIRLFTVLCDNQQTPPPPPPQGKVSWTMWERQRLTFYPCLTMTSLQSKNQVKNASCHKFSHNFWKSLLVKWLPNNIDYTLPNQKSLQMTVSNLMKIAESSTKGS